MTADVSSPNHKMQTLLEGSLSSMQWWTCGSTIFNTGCPWLSWELSLFRPAKVEKNPQVCNPQSNGHSWTSRKSWEIQSVFVSLWKTKWDWGSTSSSDPLCYCICLPRLISTWYDITYLFAHLFIAFQHHSISCRQAFRLVHHCVFSSSTVFGTKKAPVIIFWITRCIFHRILWWSLISCEMFLKPCSFAC